MKFSQLLNRKDSIKEKAQTAFVRASKLFDERWYASRYQDVFKKLKDPARHYYLVGWKENRNPSENFDTASYLRQYPECGICPIVFEHNRNDYADLAVCTIVKDEAPYIKEWLDYHLMVGVKRFYIYDNESFDNLKQVLLPYIRQGVVIYQYYPGEAMQLNCYRDCLKQYGDKNEWIAFIDADEFIIPMENATIPEFLADYKEYPAVGVNWVSYDSNGHKEKPKGGVLENYTRVHYDENMVPFHLIKSIVRPQEVSKVVNPHFFLYKGDKLAVNENKEEIGGDLSERAYISPFSTNKIRINHYYCKSRAEAETKVLRGSSDRDIRRRKNISAKELNFPDYKYDYTAYKFVLQLNPEKAKIEEIKMAWLRLKNAFIEFKHTFNPSPLYDYIDEKWYFEQYPDAKESGMSAAKHYVNIGWRKGYNPSKKFNTEFYLNKYKDVAKAHICPLLHYLNSGKNEGRLAYETDTVISATEPVSQPLLKHLSEWVKNLSKEKEREYNELWQNKAYFDENWYLKQYPDAKESGMSAKKHYDTIGWLQGYNPSAKFKTNEYLKQYPECKICPIDFEYNRNRYVDLAVCAIMKNEAPYVKEWLDYHQMVGVKRFYIYDNESGDDLCQVLLPYISKGIVVYKNYPGEAKQMPAYNEFIKEYGDKNEWVAFIDADEFIIPMEKESIPEFLADYKEYPGIGINWVAYDSNGHKAKPEGGVLENYTRVHYDENLVPFHQIKSIVQPSQVDKIINPHYALFKDNKLAVNENKQKIGGSLEERAYISPFSANKIRINHYFTKSEEEYKAKIERGRAPTKRSIKRVYNQSQVFFDDYKYDYSAYRFVAKLKPEIAQDEEVKYVWQKMKNAWIAFKHKVKHNPLYDYIDEKWYFEQYPDAKESGMSAAEHYMNIGWRKGYNPSKKFDTNFYLKKYKDVARMHVCPLLHYINSGKKENRLAFEGDTAIHTVQSDTGISAAEQTSQQIEGHTGFSPVSQPTQNNTVIPDQSNTVIPASEPVSLPLVKSLCQWCKTLLKGKEEPRLTVNTKYVANPILFTPTKSYFSDRELKAEKYENAIFLPIKSRNDGSGWFMGGVLDKDGQYVEESSIQPNEMVYGYYEYNKDNIPYVDEDVVYIGCFWNHFGHFLVELISRMWFIVKDREYQNQKLVYSIYGNDELPVYMLEILSLLGVDKNRLLKISTPAQFKTIIVIDKSTEQAKYYTQEFSEIYKKITKDIKPVYNDKIYLSRLHVKKAQETEYGEWYIEKLFAVNGYKVIYPEELSIREQIGVIKGAKKIACVSGTLSHTVLFAEAGTKLIILNKTSLTNIEQFLINEIKKVQVTYIDSYVELPFVSLGKGPFLLVNTNLLQKFAKDNNMLMPDYDLDKVKDDIERYISKWQEYSNNSLLIKKLSENEQYKEILDFKNKYIKEGTYNFDVSCILANLFDEKWYFRKYPKTLFSGLSALEHYLTIGWKLGYNPSKQFDGNAYLEKYKDVAMANINPLFHYCKYGYEECREIFNNNNMLCSIKQNLSDADFLKQSRYFDAKWYLKQYPDIARAKVDPVLHYMKDGWKEGRNPSKYFSTKFYLSTYKDVAASGINPLIHYLREGKKAGYKPHPSFYFIKRKLDVKYRNKSEDYIIVATSRYFDAKWYLKQYPDIARAKVDPVLHYIKDGWREGRNPSKHFSTKFYLSTYKDVATSGINPLIHYLREGKKAGYKPHPSFYFIKRKLDVKYRNKSEDYIIVATSRYFDAKWYLKQYPDIARAKVDPVLHYIKDGWREGRNPSKHFSTKFYLSTYKDVATSGINPLIHYLREGKKAGYRATNSFLSSIFSSKYIGKSEDYVIIAKSKYFDAKWYLKQYPDIAKAGRDPIQHYLLDGWKEGRNPCKIFNTEGYLRRYPEVKENPLLHYERVGKEENRSFDKYVNEPAINKYFSEQKKYSKIEKVVYSCVSGSYDDIITDFYPQSGFDYVLFTDSKELLKNESYYFWKIRPLKFRELDSVRNARWHKMHPDLLFPEYKYSVWIDSNVQINGDAIYRMIDEHINQGHLMASALHPERDCLYEEARECLIDHKDNPELVIKQVEIIKGDNFPAHYGLFETNVFLREHHRAEVKKIMSEWWWWINNYSRRDQLSLTYILWKNNMVCYPISEVPLRNHPEFKLYKHKYKPDCKISKNTKIKENNKLLVHLHLYYHEQLDYFISKLKNITCDYDLYITYVEKNETSETKLKKFKPEVKLIQVENKGYDLYPFVEVLNRVNLDDYSYILKMHTKNYRTNYWSYNGVNYIHYQWRDALVNALIGSKRIFRSNLKLLSKEYIGMIGNKDLISHKGAKDNEEYRLQMCEKLGYNPQYDEYIAGTMFLCKSFLMKDIQNLHLTISDFDFSSSSGVVGTLAHAMESIVGHTVQNNGLDIYGRFVFSFHRLVSYIRNQYKIYQKSKVLPPYEAIKKSKYFDAKWYLKRYPDVAKSGVDPVLHYLGTGWKENYLPSERFDGNWYLKRYKDIANANICPLLHYEKDGKYEGRKIHSDNICENAKIINEIKKSRKLGVTRFKRNPRLIVSLTTFPARIEEVVFSIYSLLEQSIKADEIILWLGIDKFVNKEKDLPDMLLKLVSRGLTIKWCKDIRSYTKLVPTLKEYPNDIIVTADDDIYYPKDWLEKLYNSYKQYPKDIQCHRVHKICLTQKCDFMPYNEWRQEWLISDASYLNFLTGVGGVLYPPHSLYKDVLKQSRFQKYAPLADDVWFWAMAVLNNTKIRNVQDGHPKLTYVNEDRENGVISGVTLANENVINGRNDEQIRNVMNVYPQIIKNIRQEIQKHTKNERKVV